MWTTRGALEMENMATTTCGVSTGISISELRFYDDIGDNTSGHSSGRKRWRTSDEISSFSIILAWLSLCFVPCARPADPFPWQNFINVDLGITEPHRNALLIPDQSNELVT